MGVEPVEGNGNHFGVIYAGVQFTVAEILGSVIAMSSFDAAKYFPLVNNRRHPVRRHGQDAAACRGNVE